MAYKTILTYVDGDNWSNDRLAAGIAITRQYDAHLTTLAFGYDPGVPPYAYGEASGLMMTQIAEQSKKAAAERSAGADAVIRAEGIRGDVVPTVSTYGHLPTRMATAARFADLVVLTQCYGETIEDTAASCFEGALFESGTPVLVVPGPIAKLGTSKVMIAWDGGREAMRAIRAAIGLLQAADEVEIVMIDPSPTDPEPGQELAAMLARHAIKLKVVVLPRPSEAISQALRRHAVESGAELLVMGGYGHSKFREYLLGGVTRDLMSNVTTPILMAH